MSVKRHIIGVLFCATAIMTFQYVMGLWALADYDPTGGRVISPEVRKKAELGRAFSRPMLAPTLWIVSKTGAELSGTHPLGWILSQPRSYSAALLVMHWLLFPFCFGAVVYLPFGLLLELRRSRAFPEKEPNQSLQPTGPSARG
jgi:hypothetical protein